MLCLIIGMSLVVGGGLFSDKDTLLSEARNPPPVPNGRHYYKQTHCMHRCKSRLIYLKRDSVKSAAVILTRGADTPEGKLGVVGVAMPDAVFESSCMNLTLCRWSYVMQCDER
jgi:hypothetical protein